MIELKLKDKEGHGYWLYDDGQFVLALKEKPVVGVQFKTKGWLRKGILALRDLNWHKKDECWYAFKFPLMKTTSFGIQIVYVEAVDGDGKEWKGWVHPRTLTRLAKTRHTTGYEKQVQILPSALRKTRELAEKEWV